MGLGFWCSWGSDSRREGLKNTCGPEKIASKSNFFLGWLNYLVYLVAKSSSFDGVRNLVG